MINRLIKATEAITTAVLNRFVSFDHNIDGSHRPWIDARNFASLSAAIDACGAAGSKSCTIAITNNQALSSNKPVLPHVTLWFANSGRITFSGGAILTVQGGMLEMGLQQRFFGTGTVVFDTGFIKRVYPQWWGAKGDGATEDTTAIQAAITAVSANALAVYFVPGNYVIDALTLPAKTNLQGDGSALTKFTRKSGASGRAMDATADADDIILKGFELDCDFEGTDGIRLGLSGSGAWGESGTIEDVKVRDCAGIGVHLSVDRATIRQLSVINADGGGVGTYQLKIEGDVANFYDLRITGETGTTANIEFTGDNINIFGMYLDDPHLTKAVRFVGDNNTITGLNIVTEDDTVTYTQLFYFETNAIENRVDNVHIEKGASDTITNSVQDDELSNTISFVNTFDKYDQYGPTVKTFNLSRDLSTASGTVAYTGVGFKPKVIKIIAVDSGTTIATWGFDDGISPRSIYFDGTNYQAVSFLINAFVSGGNFVTGVIDSFDEDGFTIDWTKTGSPTGTLTVQYLVLR